MAKTNENENPCKQCLVSTMCKKECDDLIEYVEIIKNTPSLKFPFTAKFMATQIRHGRAIIEEDGRIWWIGGQSYK